MMRNVLRRGLMTGLGLVFVFLGGAGGSLVEGQPAGAVVRDASPLECSGAFATG